MTVQFLHSKYKSECQVLNLVNFKGKKKTKLSYSIPVMDPKINGSNMAELVNQEVRKTVETQKHVMLEIKKMIEAELELKAASNPVFFDQMVRLLIEM